MSSRDYYKYPSRDGLPPIRDVLGDQLDRPPRHDSAYSFDAVHRALPSTGSSRSRSTWPQTTGPTLPPIYHSHSQGYATAGPPTPSYSSSSQYPTHSSSHSSARGRSSTPHSQSYRTSSTPQPPPQSSQAPYSFDVFRPSSSGLVHASSSSRSQGILRTTRADAGKKHAQPSASDDEDGHEDASSSKRYACPHCGKRFSRPSSLKTHEIVHSDEKPYECSYPGCGKTFTVPSNMRRHYRKTHEASSGGYSGSGDDEVDDYYHQEAAPSSSSKHYYSSSRR